MTKRLQVLFEDAELREIKRVARRDRMTVAEWVRQSLREARAAGADRDTSQKLEAVRIAATHAFPTGDIDQMLAEIESGYEDAHRP